MSRCLKCSRAEVDLYSDTPVDMEISGLIRRLMQGTAAAGVRIYVLAIIYSPANAFGFDPDDPNINGFGDATDLAAGGELAYIQFDPRVVYAVDNAFGFNPDNPDINGFGDYTDPLVGGDLAYLEE